QTAFKDGMSNYDFNLFTQAIESDTMKINMTSGACAGCAFEIMGIKSGTAEGFYYRNPIQVDGENLVSGDWQQRTRLNTGGKGSLNVDENSKPTNVNATPDAGNYKYQGKVDFTYKFKGWQGQILNFRPSFLITMPSDTRSDYYCSPISIDYTFNGQTFTRFAYQDFNVECNGEEQ
ncbi:MAG: hypothetical protein HUK05_08060, partial [Prevotella sp.]|nr:hypothetical protein [Prevotella sp.]